MSLQPDSKSLQPPLFDRLGGAPAIEQAVDRLYEFILADAELAPVFAATNLEWLKDQQVAFIGQALGGPAAYEGRDMRAAHAHLNVTSRQFELNKEFSRL